MIHFDHCSYAYPKARKMCVNDLSLCLEPGRVYGLLGSNGVGKSTLLSLACGLLTPYSGEVNVFGENVRRRLPETMSHIFIVPEEVSLPALKLSRYVATMAPFYPRFDREEMRRHLELFRLTEDINLGGLSMGEKKKVALAFAMACNTDILLMDEPTNGLDIPGKNAFRRFVAGSMSDSRTFVISTHQVRDVGQILDHVLIMDDGKILLDAATSDIQKRLFFAQTNSQEMVERSLYSEPSITGMSVILPNTADEESDINLELLFEFAISSPEKLQSLFV